MSDRDLERFKIQNIEEMGRTYQNQNIKWNNISDRVESEMKKSDSFKKFRTNSAVKIEY